MKYLSFTLLFALFAANAFASQNKTQVVVRIQGQNGNIDEATLYFDQGIAPIFVSDEDILKVPSASPGVPTIYSLTSDAVDCAINGFGTMSTSETVSMGCVVDINGDYDLSVSTLDNMNATSIIRLEDRLLGVYTDMRLNKYRAHLNSTDAATGRFFIHVSAPVQVATSPAGCTNNEGLIAVYQDPSVSWTECKLYNSANHPVGNYQNISGQFNFNGLGEGDYHAVFVYGIYSTTQNYHLSGHHITASINASSQNVMVGQNVSFSALATNSNNYSWDFGDGTLMNGVANPTINYYLPGNYTVTLTCVNDYGCTEDAQVTINVSTASGIKDQADQKNLDIVVMGKLLTVVLSDVPSVDARLQVYNLIGNSLYEQPVTSTKEQISLNEQPTGYYFVSVKNAGSTVTKRIFLAN